MCNIICTLHNIISAPYVITVLYLWHHSLYIGNHIHYAGPHIQYTFDITATNLCHHSHSIDNITHSVWHQTRIMYGIFCTLQDFTSALYDIKPPFLWHHSHYIWHRIQCICVIISNILMKSHQLNFWDHICYIWRHHIHCIWHPSTDCVSSHPLFQRHNNFCV